MLTNLTLIWMAVKCVAVQARVRYDSLGDQQERGRLGIMLRWKSAAVGGVPGQGVVESESKEANMPSCSPKYTKTAPKMTGFLHLLALKLPKTSFFDSKILDKIYFRDGF
jgi:hypothetical protein